MKKTLGLLALLALGWYFPLAWPQLGSRTGLDRGSLGRGTGEQLARMLLGISTRNLELFLGLGSYGQWYKPQRNLLQWSEDLTKSAWGVASCSVSSISDGFRITDSGTYQWSSLRYAGELALTVGAQYAFSIEVRKGNTSYFGLDIVGSDGVDIPARITFSFDTNGVPVVYNSVEGYGSVIGQTSNGYYRVFVYGENSALGTAAQVRIYSHQQGVLGSAGDYLDIRYPQLEVGTSPSTYQKTEDFQTVTDFSGKGRDAQNGSTTGADTNDADLRHPWSRNVIPKEYVNDLTNWSCSSGCTVVDSDTVTLDPGGFVAFWPNQVANTYSVFSATVNVTSGSGNVAVLSSNAGQTQPSAYVSSGRIYSTRGGAAYVVASSFTGTGIDDMTVNSGNNFSCAADYLESDYTKVAQYVVEIDATGTPDTFKWSHDGGSAWEATGVAITGSAQTLECGVQVTFSSTTGHTLGDRWTSTVRFANSYVKANPSNPTTITVDITNPQVEYCEGINCTPTPFTDPRSESVVAGAVFDGVDDFVTIYSSSLSLPQPLSVIAVARASQNKDAPYILDSLDVSGRVVVYEYPDGRYTLYAGSYVYGADGSASKWNTYSVLCGVVDGADSKLYIDGSLSGSGNAGTGGLVGLRVGSRYTGGANWDGTIGPVLVYSRALSEGEVKRATCELANRLWNWKGIPIRGATSACPSLDLTQEPLYASLTNRELNNLLLAQSLPVFDLTRLFRRVAQ